MILNVLHKTRYEFAQPVRGVIQSLRLTPAKCDSQKVLAWDIEIPGAVISTPFRDGAGDLVCTAAIRATVPGIEIIVTGQVETTDTAGVLRGHRDRVPPRAYLRGTHRTVANRAIHDLVAVVQEELGAGSQLDCAHGLMQAVADALPYRPGTTEAHTTASEAMAAGAGVCQDHAHVMISAALLAGLPARYVSGYLLASEDGSPHEASHAWAEIYIDNLGWVGFDAANRCCPNDMYIRLGSGLDATDAAPIRGLVLGDVAEKLDVTVVIEATQQ
ncbi:MAG: transglutaminase domain-containing protein [Roseinatronobacter sp.]